MAPNPFDQRDADVRARDLARHGAVTEFVVERAGAQPLPVTLNLPGPAYGPLVLALLIGTPALSLVGESGCGKSTLTTNLAAYYAMQGMNPAVMDFDPQGSAMAWLGRRRGFKLMGIVDFDVLDAVTEFLSACDKAALRGVAGIEPRGETPSWAFSRV